MTITSTLNEAKPKIRDLAAMNKHYNIHGDYQNHAGSRYVGAPVWDLWELIKDLDPAYIGCQFDIRHATVEGGQAWPLHLKIISKWINTFALKDFFWEKQKNNMTIIENYLSYMSNFFNEHSEFFFNPKNYRHKAGEKSSAFFFTALADGCLLLSSLKYMLTRFPEI